MWHFILPPIIVVACCVFVVWFLALRGSDPTTMQKALSVDMTKPGVIRRIIHGVLLRVLEKLAQRFKVLSLRIHNLLHRLLQTIKEKRKISNIQVTEKTVETPSFVSSDADEERWSAGAAFHAGETVSSSVPAVKNGGRVMQETDHDTDGELGESHVSVQRPVAQEHHAEAFNLGSPLRRRNREQRETLSGSSSENVPYTRPMVSEHAVQPEKPRRKVFARSVEEEMIARIATNPKDYTAYEALGDFYMDSGAIQDAKECYKQVLKLSPVQRMVKVKIRRLERLLSQK